MRRIRNQLRGAQVSAKRPFSEKFADAFLDEYRPDLERFLFTTTGFKRAVVTVAMVALVAPTFGFAFGHGLQALGVEPAEHFYVAPFDADACIEVLGVSLLLAAASPIVLATLRGGLRGLYRLNGWEKDAETRSTAGRPGVSSPSKPE